MQSNTNKKRWLWHFGGGCRESPTPWLDRYAGWIVADFRWSSHSRGSDHQVDYPAGRDDQGPLLQHWIRSIFARRSSLDQQLHSVQAVLRRREAAYHLLYPWLFVTEIRSFRFGVGIFGFVGLIEFWNAPLIFEVFFLRRSCARLCRSCTDTFCAEAAPIDICKRAKLSWAKDLDIPNFRSQRSVSYHKSDNIVLSRFGWNNIQVTQLPGRYPWNVGPGTVP